VRQTLRVREHRLGAQHRDVAMPLNNLGELLHERGRNDEARPLLERAVAIWEFTLGPSHPQLCAGLHNLASVAMSLSETELAGRSFERAIRIASKNLPPDHPSLAVYRAGYAELLRKMDRKKEARHLEDLVRVARKRNASENALGFTVDAKQVVH